MTHCVSSRFISLILSTCWEKGTGSRKFRSLGLGILVSLVDQKSSGSKNLRSGMIGIPGNRGPKHIGTFCPAQEEFSRPVIRLENALEVQAAAAQADAGLQVPQVPLSMGRSQGTGRALGVIGDQRGRGQSTHMLPTAYSSTGGDMNPLNPARSHTVGAIGPVAFVPSVPAGPAPAGPILGTGQTASSLGPHAPKPHGTKELPSVGSAGHAFGTCKPCGFFYAKGCLNGAACSFCHLCDRGEKKRRQKQKKACLKGGA